MSKKYARQIEGTYALSITVGLFAGLGLAPMFNNGMIPPLIGIVAGVAVGYFIVHRSRTKKT